MRVKSAFILTNKLSAINVLSHQFVDLKKKEQRGELTQD